MEIRKIRDDDANDLLHMLLQIDTETKYMMFEPGERPQDINMLINRIKAATENEDLFICSVLNDEIVGFLSAAKGDFKRNKHCAYIVIGILSKGQSKGFGSQMFDQLMEWSSTQNITRLELTVMCHNEGALALYKKFGFEVEGIKRHSLFIDGNYVDEYYMAKLL